MKHERYIISEEEVGLLNRYEEIIEKHDSEYYYDHFSKETLAQFCSMKDRSNDLFFRRYTAAREVIDLIAKQAGIDPNDTGFWLYAPDVDGKSPIVDRMEGRFSRSGEKAQLKRRLQELEQEYSLLRSLIQK